MEMVRHFQEVGMFMLLQAIGLTVVVVVMFGTPALIYIYCIKKPLPGTLKYKGEFECEDPSSDAHINERRRDFARIVSSKRDLWVFTPQDKKERLLPVTVRDLNSRSGINEVYEDFKNWLKAELNQIPGGTWTSGRTLGWPVIDRCVNLIAVSPEFEFLRRQKVAPRAMQAKWVLIISASGQVRVAWYAFVADEITPGMTSGPFVLKLVSEDLNGDRKGPWCTYQYSCLPTSKKNMEDIIHEQSSRLLEAISTDNWPNFYTDFS